MGAPKKVPDKTTLARWQREGLTQQQMVERILSEQGITVSRPAIAGAMVRYGLAEDKVRHNHTIPWRVKVVHISSYPARMLRLLGRRLDGMHLNNQENKKLDSWLALLEREDAVVAYDPDSVDGFMYVDREPQDPKDVPIRVKRVYLNYNN
jgi:hypothetical protein